jgi:hypothetical protein
LKYVLVYWCALVIRDTSSVAKDMKGENSTAICLTSAFCPGEAQDVIDTLKVSRGDRVGFFIVW